MSRSRLPLRVLPVVLATLAGAASAYAQAPGFHLIGALPGSNTFSSGYGVSEDGSVVVGHSGNNYYYGSSSHAFRWSDDTGIQDLDPLAPAAGAYGISADGTLIVGGETSGSVKAVSWGSTTSGITDQLYHGGECYNLSRDGSSAVGWSASGGGGGGGGGAFRPHRAIRYSLAGSSHLEYIDTPGTGVVAPTNSEALATNTNGSVVVGWGVFGGVQRAFRWTAADNMTILTPSAGIANGVSGDGSTIVGDFATAGTRHAFRWTAATGLVDMGTLPGMTSSVAYAISNDGSTIVGKTQSSTGLQRAFIWRADIGMQDLNTVLAAVMPAGFTLTEGRALNSNGTVIAGGSKTPTLGVEAWVVTIPSCVSTTVVSSPAARTVSTGATVDLAVTVGGFGPFTYQWRKDAQPISGATSAHLVITPAALADTGAYDCVITGACGGATSSPSALVVVPSACNPADITGAGGSYINGAMDVPVDGQLTIEDFLGFLSAFGDATGCPGTGPCNPADITGAGGSYSNGAVDVAPDGDLTIEDFLSYLSAFGDGCP